MNICGTSVFLLCDKMSVLHFCRILYIVFAFWCLFYFFNIIDCDCCDCAVLFLLFNNSCFSATGGALIRCFFFCLFHWRSLHFCGCKFIFLCPIFRCVIKFALPLNSFYSCCYCFSNRIGVFHCSKLQLYRFAVCFHLVLCECDTMWVFPHPSFWKIDIENLFQSSPILSIVLFSF